MDSETRKSNEATAHDESPQLAPLQERFDFAVEHLRVVQRFFRNPEFEFDTTMRDLLARDIDTNMTYLIGTPAPSQTEETE